LLQRVTDEIRSHDMIAKIGATQEGWDSVVRRHGLGDERSENGVPLVSFCAANYLAIVSQCFHIKTYINTPGLLLVGGSEIKSIMWQ